MNEYLVHYGVKGMKWGKRKAIDNSGKGDKYLQSKKDDFNKEAKLHAGFAQAMGGKLKYASKKDEAAAGHLGRKLLGSYNKAQAYKRSGEQAVRDAIRSVKSGNFKAAVSYGKLAIESMFKRFSANMEYKKASSYKDTSSSYGSLSDTSRVTRKYGDGTTINYETSGKYNRKRRSGWTAN